MPMALSCIIQLTLIIYVIETWISDTSYCLLHAAPGYSSHGEFGTLGILDCV